MKKKIIPCLLIICLVVTFSYNSHAQAAQQVIGNITVEGSRQGDFNEGSKKDKEIPIIGFTYNVQVPYDAAAGRATGKRHWDPITITKNIDNASPQLFSALVSNEVLKTVTVNMIIAENGKQKEFQTIRLTNAVIVKITQFEGAGAPGKLIPNYTPMEEVSILFQKIEIEGNKGKTISSDDWLIDK
jgi:type VI secretion system secreted protein Hcp